MSSKNNAKYAFWYMLSLVALIFMALGCGQVIFQIINKTILDFTGMYSASFNSSMLKFAISSLIISIPLYYLMVRQIERGLRSGDLDKDSGIRRWLTYVILFASSVVMVVWLIVTINNFLNGELTSKFLLKAVTAIIIAGITFSYYLYDIRRDDIKKMNWVMWTYFAVSMVLTVGSLVAAFFFVESPAEARARNHDTQVLNSFTQIDSALGSYYTQTGKLPATLAQINEQAPYINQITLQDPQSKKMYDYKVLDETTYQLCADFQTDNTKDMPGQDYTYADRWPHATGYQCLKQKTLNYTTDVQVKPVTPAR